MLLLSIPLEEFIERSPEIVVGRPEIEGNSVKLKVEGSLKGSHLKPGDVISLCPLDIYPRDVTPGKSLLLFLKGKDTKRNEWTPTQSAFGAVSINEFGKFQVGQGVDPYSLNEIRQAITKSQN